MEGVAYWQRKVYRRGKAPEGVLSRGLKNMLSGWWRITQGKKVKSMGMGGYRVVTVGRAVRRR